MFISSNGDGCAGRGAAVCVQHRGLNGWKTTNTFFFTCHLPFSGRQRPGTAGNRSCSRPLPPLQLEPDSLYARSFESRFLAQFFSCLLNNLAIIPRGFKRQGTAEPPWRSMPPCLPPGAGFRKGLDCLLVDLYITFKLWNPQVINKRLLAISMQHSRRSPIPPGGRFSPGSRRVRRR